jgi:translation initiation factor 2 subunit 3
MSNTFSKEKTEPVLQSSVSNGSSKEEPEPLCIREAEVMARQATHLVGTLGHVSEGKSTLIRALTGVKTQRHAKEQERNITIHLGYANCRVYQNQDTGALRASTTPVTDPDWTS